MYILCTALFALNVLLFFVEKKTQNKVQTSNRKPFLIIGLICVCITVYFGVVNFLKYPLENAYTNLMYIFITIWCGILLIGYVKALGFIK